MGNSVRMDCSATGYPKPTVKWYKDKALFQERKGGSKLYIGMFQTLVIIRDAVPADSGLYTCNVSNAYGWINNSYTVDVRGKGMERYDVGEESSSEICPFGFCHSFKGLILLFTLLHFTRAGFLQFSISSRFLFLGL